MAPGKQGALAGETNAFNLAATPQD